MGRADPGGRCEPPIYFASRSHNYDFLSNFSPHPVIFHDQHYPTAEHAYQAQKTHDWRTRARIARAPTPVAAKHAGRTVRLRNDWYRLRKPIMLAILRAKFHQHPELAARLRASAPRQLIHRAPWDGFWGDGREGRGYNLLGQLLEQVRGEL